MQAGIGSKYTKDRRISSEDHININGNVYKLDRTNVFFSRDEEDGGEIVTL